MLNYLTSDPNFTLEHLAGNWLPLRAKENTVTAKYTYEAKSMLSHEGKYLKNRQSKHNMAIPVY